MTTISIIRKLVLPTVLFLSFAHGCAEKEPVTIVFTGDTQGRLVPAG